MKRARRGLRRLLAAARAAQADSATLHRSLDNVREIALEAQRLSDQTRQKRDGVARIRSGVCTYEQLTAPWYEHWCSAMRLAPVVHRKQWEWAYIAQALDERGLLAPGRRGLGFGVGQEPLTALFASRGVDVVATDQSADAQSASGWADSGQHARNLAQLNAAGICDPAQFAARVSFREVDMNAIPPDLGEFDFTWSACAMEHLGSLEAGIRFVEQTARVVRPGGVAVHTTEYNLSSDSDTLTSGAVVIYRRSDIAQLVARLARFGLDAGMIDFDPGAALLDRFVDVPPFGAEPHLRLLLGQYTCTSIGLLFQRNGERQTRTSG